MDIESIKAARGLYRNGLMSREDFIGWADDIILNGNVVDSNLFESLMYISLMGKKHINDFKYVHDDFCLVDDFAVKIAHLDTGNMFAVEKFNNWVSGRASQFYQIDKEIGCYGYGCSNDDDLAWDQSNLDKKLGELKLKYQSHSEEIWSKIT